MILKPTQNRRHGAFRRPHRIHIVLGGLVNTKGISNKNFHDMIEILLVFGSPYTLALAGGDTVPKDDAELKPGNYYVDGKFTTHAHS